MDDIVPSFHEGILIAGSSGEKVPPNGAATLLVPFGLARQMSDALTRLSVRSIAAAADMAIPFCPGCVGHFLHLLMACKRLVRARKR